MRRSPRRNNLKRALTTIMLICAVLLTSACAFGQARTTPVEVKNPVSINATNNTVKALIDPLGNTVKAEQSGNWTVAVSGTPNVAVANTPSVNVANSVKIDATANTVKTSAKSDCRCFWSVDQPITAGGNVSSGQIDCSGYKEMRVMISLAYPIPGGLDLSKVKIYIYFVNPHGVSVCIGLVNLAAASIIDHPHFETITYTTSFIVPVMSNTANLLIYNDNSVAAQLSKDSFVYLVN